jgi:hypothetical protein
MSESIKQRIGGMSSADKVQWRKLMDAVLADLTALRANIATLTTDASKAYTLTGAGLTIASGKKTATCGTAFWYMAGGAMHYKAAGDCSALAGTIADAKAAAWTFYIDAAGDITTSAKTADAANAAAAAALAAAVAVPAGLAAIGVLIVSSSGATFVGGTTDLDAGTATDVYYSFIGPAATTSTTSTATLTVVE